MAKRARPAADADGAEDWGDSADDDAEQDDTAEGAAGQPALDPAALQVCRVAAEVI